MRYFDNHFLFSETYIKEYLKLQKNLNGKTIDHAYKAIKEYHDEYGDSWLDEYIPSSIAIAGFQYTAATTNILTLYTNNPSSGDKPVAVLYAVEKDIDLNFANKGNYLAYKAVSVAKQQGLDWAMLTNGYKWRIYHAKNVSPYENYLEVDIENSLRHGKTPDDAFTLYYLLFNARTYYRDESGELAIEQIKDKSDEKAEQVEDFLRGKAEEILKDICYGLKEDMGQESYDRETCRRLYQDAITLLFRLLFFGYAESRGLLPCDKQDVEYRQNSFFKLCDEARDILNAGIVNECKSSFSFWDRLDEHLRIYVDQTYNGGLFNNDDKFILRNRKIANRWLVKCLAEISFKKDKRTGAYTDKIEYKDLSVRNLGSIYEGLLEYNLFIAEEQMVRRTTKGKTQYLKTVNQVLKKSDESNILEKGDIYLSQDATERKDTGAYYTPEDVVEFIVDNTVGKKLADLQTELKELLQSSFGELNVEPTQSGRKRIQQEIDEKTLTFVHDRIANLMIVDTAMGSGHFLVNAAYRLANGIVETLCDNDWENEEIPVDITYWKRKVVEQCIYGIDINGLAVTLAKLSLWLISAANDKALSFLDHHLKEGNSIVGTDRHQVRTSKQVGGVWETSYSTYMAPVIAKYQELNGIGSRTKEDVERQKIVYAEIQDMLKLIKKKYDYYLASQCTGGITDEFRFAYLLKSQDTNDFEKPDMDALWRIATEKKFFHWELEFPEVFMRGGFDVALGNPPYVDVVSSEYRKSNLATINAGNLYAYMMEISINNCKKAGYFGFIVPLSSMYTPRMLSLQEFMTRGKEVYISNYAIRPAKLFKNVEQRISIFCGKKSINPGDEAIYTSKYIRWHSKERKKLFSSIVFIPNSCKRDLNIEVVPKIGTSTEIDLLNKIYCRKTRVKNYIDNETKTNFVCYHGAARYWLKAFNFVPDFFSETKGRGQSSEYKTIYFNESINPNIFVCLINSSLFYWYWITMSDERHFLRKDIEEFPFDIGDFNDASIQKLNYLASQLMESLKSFSSIKTVNLGGKAGVIQYREFRPRYSKAILDEIDLVIGNAYGFSMQEIKFILNYDIMFRMGDVEGV